MLVLSRKANEKIIIGEGDDQIVVQVVEVRPDRVRLGITAREGITIFREEIYEDFKKRNQGK